MEKLVLVPGTVNCDDFLTALAEDLGGHIPGHCDHTLRYARAIMERMGVVDVEFTLSLFATYGGTCDCEIVRQVT